MISYAIINVAKSAFKKGKQKYRVDEADISSLLHQPARNAFGILWAGQTAPAGNAFTYRRAKK